MNHFDWWISSDTSIIDYDTMYVRMIYYYVINIIYYSLSAANLTYYYILIVYCYADCLIIIWYTFCDPIWYIVVIAPARESIPIGYHDIPVSSSSRYFRHLLWQTICLHHSPNNNCSSVTIQIFNELNIPLSIRTFCHFDKHLSKTKIKKLRYVLVYYLNNFIMVSDIT